MKRLVVCFDGTWKRAQDTHVSNIEKIARTLRSESDGVQQTVYYVGGVGASYRVDRILGGSLGFGLTNNLLSAYRFVALNFTPGDQVFIFGFSRGAFTARSLAGIIDKVGLVRADALIRGPLAVVEDRYRHVLENNGETAAEFKRDFCHPHVCIPFVGVFDTVEALGPRARFHNIQFCADAVAVGRQAMAIDERRRIFWPQLWAGDPSLAQSDRVRQVWFEGFHSDIGGGVDETGLPDTTLMWMAVEASRQGLVFDSELLTAYLTAPTGSQARRHDSMNPGYRLTNALMRHPLAKSYQAFSGSHRVLAPEASVGVRISSAAKAHYDEGTYDRPNIESWLSTFPPGQAPVEPVLAFPELDADLITATLDAAAASASARGGATVACPAHVGLSTS